MKRIQMIVLAGLFAAAISACTHESHEQGVSFRMPKDGATLSQVFTVGMEVKGMRVHKAGEVVDGTGHFHIIVDSACVKQGDVIGKDATHIHFGKGQTESKLKLAPGEHALTLQFANGHHESYGKGWCRTIHITVK